MRILHIISCMVKADGHSQFCMALAERMAASGEEQRIFTLPSEGGERLPDPNGLICYARGRPIHVFNITVRLGLKRQLAAVMRAWKPAVVHLHGGWHPVLFFGARLAKRMGIPIVLSLHGSLRPVVVEGDRRLKKRLAWRVYQRRLVAMADMIQVSSETEREDPARLGFRQPVVVVPNGVDLEPRNTRRTRKKEEEDGGSSKVRESGTANIANRANGEISRQDAKTQSEWQPARSAMEPLNLDPLPPGTSVVRRDGTFEPLHTRTVLYLGRLHPVKGLDLLVSAWKQVVSDFNGWQLLIVGPDEKDELFRLREQVQRLELEERVTFVGPVYGDEKDRVMAEADLFVLPTRGENFGSVVAEALACDVPVITTKGVPWSELLGNLESSKMQKSVTANGANQANGGQWAVGSGEMEEEYRDKSLEYRGESTEGLTKLQTLDSRLSASGRCGWWVDIGVEPLAEALREAMRLTDAERQAMGENGRRLVERKYRWETVVEKMMEGYENLPANLRE